LPHLVGLLAAKIGLYQAVQIPLVLGALALATLRPGLGAPVFDRLERCVRRLDRRPMASLMLVGACALALRALLIPFIGGMQPIAADETSLLLQASTLVSGRLTNPHPPGGDFESVFVLLSPTYASMYPVLRSLPLAVGDILFHAAWPGVWLSMAGLAMSIHWMLSGWMKVRYAFVGAMLVVLSYGLYSYWINSAFGPAFTAFGGALVLGAYPRLTTGPTLSAGCALGVGVLVLMTTRPFEGLMFSAPFAVGLLVRFLKAPSPGRGRWLVAGAGAAVFVAFGLVITAADDLAVTGDWREAPYSLYRRTTAETQPFFHQGLQARPPARYFATRWFLDRETLTMRHASWVANLIGAQWTRWPMYANVYLGAAFIGPFALGVFALRRQVVVIASGASLAAGLAIETFALGYYAAPAMGLVMLCVMTGLESLRSWRPQERPVGRSLARWLPLCPCLALLLPTWSSLTRSPPFEDFDGHLEQACCWIRPRSIHVSVDDLLDRFPGPRIVVADTGPTWPRGQMIVFNPADIAAARSIWVNQDAALNPATFARYPGRRIWRLTWTKDGGACLFPDFGGDRARAAKPPLQIDGAASGAMGGWSPGRGHDCPAGLFHPAWGRVS
jgi:hypothetical protein